MGKREEEEEAEGNSERWLLTYSDMITLLLALFIIMYGMSAADSEKVKQMSQGLEEALNPSKVTEENAGGGGTGGTDATSGSGTEGNATSNMDNVVKQLEEYIDKHGLKSEITLSKSDAGVCIQLKDTLLFHPNTATLLNAQTPVIGEIGKALQAIYSSIDHISIIGNTADVGNHDLPNEIDSYVLSTQRAIAVLSLLTYSGVKPNKLVVEGHSHYTPVATNKTSEGRAKNRRVEIMIYKYSINALASKAKELSKTEGKDLDSSMKTEQTSTTEQISTEEKASTAEQTSTEEKASATEQTSTTEENSKE